MKVLAWCLATALAAPLPAVSPAPSPAPSLAPAEPSYYVKFWAQDDDGKKVWELGLATREDERANVTDGHVAMFLIPHRLNEAATGRPVIPKEANATAQESTNGVQLSLKVNARADAKYQAEVTWTWSRGVASQRTTWGQDRLERQGTMRVTGKQATPMLINQLSSPHQQNWKIYLQVDAIN